MLGNPSKRYEILKSVRPTIGVEPRSRCGVRNALSPTMEEIAVIGTRDAVRRYDALHARG